MGALRLTYKENYRPLKVVRGNFYLQKNSDAERYEFGFNGQLKDNEIYGEGNIYDYGFRIYNPRVVRFLSVDPLFKSYPFYTPYQFAGNSPILFVDLDGLERARPKQNTGKTAFEIYTDKYGAVDLYTPEQSYKIKKDSKFRKSQKRDITGWGYNEKNNPAIPQSVPTSLGGQNPNEIDLSNPLDRSENFEFQRLDIVPLYDKGNIQVDFNVLEGEEGTVEIGIVTQEGSERILVSTTVTESGSINTDFELKDGEELYFRSENTYGTTNIGATRIEDNNSDEE